MNNPRFVKRGDWIVIIIIAIIIVWTITIYAATPENRTIDSNSMKPNTIMNEIANSSDSIHYSSDYVGPPSYMRNDKIQKYKQLVLLDINSVDSLSLIRVPGIGPAFAHRILSLRNLLGGYYTVEQLQEVYGMDEEKYLSLRRWFVVKTPPKTYLLENIQADSIPKHIYISYKQRRALEYIIYKYGRITSWRILMQNEAFNRDDSVRLSHYLLETKN